MGYIAEDRLKELLTLIKDNYDNSSEVDKKIADAIGGGGSGIKIEIVTVLPQTGESGVIYLVPSSSTASGNLYDEYVWISDKYELIGSKPIDLSGYIKKNDNISLLANDAGYITASSIEDTYSATSEKAMSGKAVAAALNTVKTDISADTGNIITTGTDGGIYASAASDWTEVENKPFKSLNTKDFSVDFNGELSILPTSGAISVNPIGAIVAVMGKTAPTGYLACDGSVYSISKYKELADYIKEQFGSYDYFGGDGTTTFAVPDLVGRFLKGDVEAGISEEAGLPNITGSTPHTMYAGGQATVSNGAITQTYSTGRAYTTAGTGSNGWYVVSVDASKSNAIYGNSETVTPENISVLYCIKATNASIDIVKEINNYSEEETVIGRWIDGKPLYRKCFKFTSLSSSIQPNVWTNLFTVPFDNLDQLIKSTPVSADSNNPCEMNYLTVSYFKNENTFKCIHSRNINLSITNNSFIICEYTKITD